MSARASPRSDARRFREVEARLAATLDQLLRDHAEWTRLKEADGSAPPTAGAPAPAPPPARKAPRKRSPAPTLQNTESPPPSPAQAKDAPKPRKKRSAAPGDRARMRRLKQAQRKLEAMGVKPWKAKKTPGGKAQEPPR